MKSGTKQAPARTWRWKVLFAALAIILALGALELVARAVELGATGWESGIGGDGVPPPVPLDHESARTFGDRLMGIRQQAGHKIVMVDDEARGWTLPKGVKKRRHMDGSTRSNSLGLRGPEVTPRAPGEQRLLTLGDSSIFGAAVPEKYVFSSVAARELERRWGSKVSAVIGAIPGYDSSQSLTTLKQVGAKVEPTWVVIGNLWSDLYYGDAELTQLKRRAFIRGPLGRFALYRQIRRFLPGLEPMQVHWIVSNDDLGDPSKGRSTRIPLKHYTQNLEEMLRLSNKLGARVLFLILPAPMDLSDDISDQPTVEKFRGAMRAVAARHGAPVVDGPAVFKEADAGLAWFMDNVHRGAEGHELLGKAVAAALAKAGKTAAPASP